MGTIGVISRITGLDAEIITFYRLFFGAGFMLMYLLATKKAGFVYSWPSWQVLINGFFLAAFILFYVQATNYTSLANAIMTIYLAPVAASVLAHFFLKEKLRLPNVILIIAALTGFLMMMEFKLDFTSGTDDAVGFSYGLLALGAYAGFIIINRLIPDRVHVYSRSWYQLAIGALCILPFAISKGGDISAIQWGWLILAGVFPGFLAIMFAVVALRHLPATVFGTLAYLEPISVVLFGWLIFAETLSQLQLFGCFCILASGIVQGRLATRSP